MSHTMVEGLGARSFRPLLKQGKAIGEILLVEQNSNIEDKSGLIFGANKYSTRNSSLLSYLTGMRAGEIFNLTWDRVDLANRIVRLEAEDTKTTKPRVVFLCDQAYDILKEAGKVRHLDHNRVFTNRGRPLKKIKKALPNGCRKAGTTNFRFHDLRHTFNTNMRKAGVDQSVIMKLTGHKTLTMFQRYNTVDLDDAVIAYQKLDLILEQGGDSAPAGKCSHSAPGGGICKASSLN